MMSAGDAPVAAWPRVLAGIKPALSAVLAELSATEKLPAETCAAEQSRQLTRLLTWAHTYVPYYRDSAWLGGALAALARGPERFWEVWRALPTLPKTKLRTEGARLHAERLPDSQQPIGTTRTSGSTGIPVEVRTTALTRLLWNALTLREHLWRQRPFGTRLGAIRYLEPDSRDPVGVRANTWGPPASDYTQTGPASAIHVGLPLATWVHWLAAFDPHHLLTYPSVAEALLDSCDRPPSLGEVRLFSEPVTEQLERRLKAAWGVTVSETYSANETGYIALRCAHGSLHVQSENVLVEILDDRGAPCSVGESGRVVVTPLHNLATPLIRYDIGDYATVGGACACGRELPVISKVLGRVRNLATSPEGGRFWPVELARIRSVSAARQFQYVQTARDTVRLRLVLSRPLSDGERADVVRLARGALGHPFAVEIEPVAAIARGSTGKFEEFLSLLQEPPA